MVYQVTRHTAGRVISFSGLCAALGICLFLLPSIYADDSASGRNSERRTPKGTKAIRVLESGQVIKRVIGWQETQVYEIVINKNEYAQLLLTFPGNRVIRIFTPDGEELPAEYSGILQLDCQTSRGYEVSLLASESGTYRIEITASHDNDDYCEYQLKVNCKRPATADDMRRVDVFQDYSKILRLHGQKRAESYLKCIEIGKQTAPRLRELGETYCESNALYLVGESYWELGRYPEALNYMRQALAVAVQTNGAIYHQANVLISIGQTYQKLSDYQKALEAYSEALSLIPDDHNRIVRAWGLDNMAVAYESLGEKQKALDYHHKAAELYKAFDRGVGDPRGSAHAYTHLGALYASMGEKQKGINYLNSALPLWQKAHDPWGEGRAYHRIGDVYASLGDFQIALDYYQQALAKWRESGDRDAEAGTLYSLASVHHSLGDDTQAFYDLQQSLAIRQLTGNREGQAQALTRVGELDYARRNWSQALASYNLALALWRDIGNPNGEGEALNGMADVLYATGELAEALTLYNAALPLRWRVADHEGAARTFYGLARIARDNRAFDEARQQIEFAIAIVERVRNSVTSDQLRTAYLAKVRDYYEFLIDLLMQTNGSETATNSAAAFEASERARARSLLDLLNEAGANIREGVDPQLLGRERELRQRLNGKAEYQNRLLQGHHDEDQAAAVAREIESLSVSYDQVRAEIRATSPRYAALTQPRPVTLAEIQQSLDADTLLLEYALGENQSYLWVVSKASLTAYQLQPRAEIETAARELRDSLSEYGRCGANKNSADYRMCAQQADAKWKSAAQQLSHMLIEPAAAHLANKRLLIVADGALQYVPFVALPASESDGTGVVPLVTNHEIINLPSASTLLALRRELTGRTPATKTLALMADPVFSAGDARLLATKQKRKKSRAHVDTPITTAMASDLTRALRDVDETQLDNALPRLFGTRWEARQITKLVPPAERLIALDFAASRTTAMSNQLSRYRIIHFASHALINGVHPELSGIVLSLVDSRGRPRDGFLRLHEIYNLKLPAEIIVLNACRTGLGKEVRGEGLIGLTRGFMYAGAARVLVSLWSVDDRAAAELMQRVYKRMLGPERLSPAAALRAAQIDMMSKPQWQSPYYWAAFSLQGEWQSSKSLTTR